MADAAARAGERVASDYELRARLRSGWFWVYAGAHVLVTGGLAAWSMAAFPALWGGVSVTDVEGLARASRLVGAVFAYVICSAQFPLVALMAALFTGGSLAGERARRSLTFVLMTPLPTGVYVRAKVRANTLATAGPVLATLPLTALAALGGGLSPGEVVALYALLLSYGWCLVAFGVMVSARVRSAGRAAALTLAAALGAVVLCPYLTVPALALWAFFARGERAPLMELVMTAPMPFVALTLTALFVGLGLWFVAETTRGLDAERLVPEDLRAMAAAVRPREEVEEAEPEAAPPAAGREGGARRW